MGSVIAGDMNYAFQKIASVLVAGTLACETMHDLPTSPWTSHAPEEPNDYSPEASLRVFFTDGTGIDYSDP
jgi:hypothetical protein